jgi:hypothetical protein
MFAGARAILSAIKLFPFSSSVLRDAIHMQAVSENNTGDTKAKKLDLEINCSLAAAKLLFAILAGRDYKSLSSTSSDEDKELHDLFTKQSSDIPLVPVLREFLAQPDFLDIPFVPRLSIELLYSLGRLGKYHSLSTFTIAVQLGHVALAKFAVKRMVGLPNPLVFDESTVRNLQLDAWRLLVQAYHKVVGPVQSLNKYDWARKEWAGMQGCTAWVGDAAQWKLLSEAILIG